MTAPMFVRNANSQLYAGLYTSLWRTGIWLPDQAWEIQKDPETWEKVRRDPVIEHAISARLHNIAAREQRVNPGGEDDASKQLAELCESMLDEVEGITAAQYQLAQFVMLGRTYGWMEGRREPRQIELGGKSLQLDLWMPKRIRPVDKRRIRFTPMPSFYDSALKRNIPGKVQAEIGSFDFGTWRRLSDEDWANLIKPVYNDDESRVGSGRGMLGAIYFYHYAKGVTLREGLKGIERWAQGLKVVTIDEDRAASTGKTNEQIQQDYLDVIEKNMARNTLTMSKGDTLDVKWPSGEGGRMVHDMLTYLDRGITQLILGSVMPTGGGGEGGSFARASVEEDASERLFIYDRRVLDESLTRDLVGQFVRVNRPQLRSVGLDKAKLPRIRSVNEKKQDPEIAARIARTLIATGISLRADEVYEKCGWTKPKPGEEIIEGTKPSAGGMPVMGGGGFPGGDDGPGAGGDEPPPEDGASGNPIPDSHQPDGEMEEPPTIRTAYFSKFKKQARTVAPIRR